MEITAEMVKKRLEQLRRERGEAVAQVNGYDGAIQDAEWFLEQLNKEEHGKAEAIQG